MWTRGTEVTEGRLTSLFTVAGALYDLCNQDALCVVEQEVFDKLYSVIRCALDMAHDRGYSPNSCTSYSIVVTLHW